MNTNKNNVEFKLINYRKGWKSLEDDWFRLFNKCERPCIFYHPIFLGSAIALPMREQPTHIVIGRQDGRIIFGLPAQIMKNKFLLKEFNFYSFKGFDHLAPLDSTLDWKVTEELFGNLWKQWGIDLIKAKSVDQGLEARFERFGEKGSKLVKDETFRCPYLPLQNTEQKLFSSLSKNLRYDIKRKFRRAEKEDIQFRMVNGNIGNYNLRDAIHNLLVLHDARFASLKKDSNFTKKHSRAFHKKVCKEADRFKGIVHFFEALHNDRVIGSSYGFVSGNRFYYYNSGFASGYEKLSIGTLLTYKIIQYLIDNNILLFDFLRGQEEYKFRWTKAWSCDLDIIAALSPLGNLGIKWVFLKKAIKEPVRQLIGRF